MATKKMMLSEQTIPPTPLPRIRLLVVDDEYHFEILLMQKFRHKIQQGEYEFYFSQSGQNALDVFKEHPDIELVITDINMPGMDGITLLKEIQRLYPQTKTMVMSAYSDEKRRDGAHQAGAIKFITKPISLKNLESTIEETIEEIVAERTNHAGTAACLPSAP